MEEIGIIANMRDGLLVPDFGQQRTAWLFQCLFSPLASLAPMAAGNRVYTAYFQASRRYQITEGYYSTSA